MFVAHLVEVDQELYLQRVQTGRLTGYNIHTICKKTFHLRKSQNKYLHYNLKNIYFYLYFLYTIL